MAALLWRERNVITIALLRLDYLVYCLDNYVDDTLTETGLAARLFANCHITGPRLDVLGLLPPAHLYRSFLEMEFQKGRNVYQTIKKGPNPEIRLSIFSFFTTQKIFPDVSYYFIWVNIFRLDLNITTYLH